MRIALPPADRSGAVEETLRTQLRFHFPGITEVAFAEDGVDIEMADEVPAPDVSATIQRLDDKLRDLPAVPVQVVYDSAAGDRPSAGRHDPAAFDVAVRHLAAELTEAVDLATDTVATRAAGRGMNRYGTEATVLHRVLDNFLRRYFVHAYRAADIHVPSMLPTEVLDRAGYLETASQHLCFVSPLDPDPATFDQFLPFWREHASDGIVAGPALQHYLAPPRDVLNPAMCLHCFEPLAGTDVGTAPAVFTLVGSCFRDESGNLNHAERLREFTMREALFVGPPDALARIHGELVDFMIEVGGLLGLDIRLETATDMFFTAGAVDRLFSQLVTDNKLELTAAVAGAGHGRRIATASLNKHHDHFTPRFEISAGGRPAVSMCIAFGLDRLALAVTHRLGSPGGPVLAALLERAVERR